MAGEITDPRLGERLAEFFEKARLPLCRQNAVESRAFDIDRERLGRFIEQLRAPLDREEAQACTNPWRAARLGNDEVRVSAVLAALWDRQRYGDEARAFLARFLARAGSGFPDEDELSHAYRVQTERCMNGAVSERVDITVETISSIVGIEVKILAGEGENQLARYVAAIETRARLMGRLKHSVIFLSPYFPKGDAEKVSKVTWRTVAETAAQADRSTHAGWLICQFGDFCGSFGG